MIAEYYETNIELSVNIIPQLLLRLNEGVMNH